jgi:hypothetical protein
MDDEAKSCESCGMPMQDAKAHGGGDKNNPYCVYCTDQTGKLKSRQDVRKGMIHFYMAQMGRSREEAEKFVDGHMKKLPAWK